MMIARRSARPLAALLAALLLTLPGCRGRETNASPPPPAKPGPSQPARASTAVVIASVSGVEPGGEPVEAALQTEAQWGTEDAIYRARAEADAASVALRFDGVVPGRYALVAVQPALAATVDGRTRIAGGDRGPATEGSPATVSLKPAGAGGWAASGAERRRRPDWESARVAVPPDGATIPLTLGRR